MKRIALFSIGFILMLTILLIPTFGAGESTAVLVTENDVTSEPDQLLSDWESGDYAYIKLLADTDLTMNGEELLVDLAGYQLTVSGTGSIGVFDTANDTYDETACGGVVNNGEVAIAENMEAPNGNKYVTVIQDGKITAHRITIDLSHVTLRTERAGLYYRATYYCDPVLAENVKRFGVVVSVHNMPGSDFAAESVVGNNNRWTVAELPFKSGITVNSGSVFNIFGESNSVQKNDSTGKIKIYANAYVDFGSGAIVADTENAGKCATDASFTGVALSLYDVLKKLDDTYEKYSTATQLQLDKFYAQWKEKGMGDWGFTNIGTAKKVDNSNLIFDSGTTDAVCPVCDKKVTWITVDQISHGASGYGIIQNNGEHVCLVGDIVYSGADYFISAPTTGTKTACLHLNGHSIKAKKSRAIAGSGGILNVMGNGAVIGNYADAAKAYLGSTVNINTNGSNGALNLYGGTYSAAAGNTQDTVISLYNNGGKLRIYEDATVISDGYAIKVGTANLVPAELTIRGTVTGKVSLAGANYEKGQSSTFNLDGGIIEGGLELGLNNIVNISGTPVVGGTGMEVPKGLLVKLNELKYGTSIPVKADGVFAEATEHTSRFANFFTSVDSVKMIVPNDNLLSCEKNYESNLKFTADGKTAFCPVCEKNVQWIALTETAITMVKDAHYFLTTDINYTKNSAAYLTGATSAAGAGKVCLHLNGHNITATQYRAINIANAKLNIMGTGTIYGNRVQNLGAVIYSGYSHGELHIYSGTVTKGSGNVHPAVVMKTGALDLHEGAKVEGGITFAASITDTTAMNVFGATVTGMVTLNGGNMLLSGAPKIEKLSIAEGVKINLTSLAKGTDIKVSATGFFTGMHPQSKEYLAYFTSVDANKQVEVQGSALACKTDAAEDDTLYILTAAASNSHYFLDELYGILEAAGIQAKVCNLMKDSTGINAFYNHWKNGEKVFQLIIHDENGKTVINNMGLDDALAYYNWDIFNMQEGTSPHRQTTPQEGGTATSTPRKVADERRVAHTALVEHVRKTLPMAKLYYQEIWSYDIGFNRFNYQMTTGEQQLAFSASIKEYTDIVCEEFNLLNIPCGQAWILARESELCDKLCARLSYNNGEGDYYHDGDIGGGQYLNACVWFETLTGQSCVGNTFRPVYTDNTGNTYTLSEELITVLQQAAHEAVANMRAENE